MRLSVTDRCNLRCFYCLPAKFKDFAEPEHWLSFDEIERLIRIFSELGVAKLRITGGEPLVRKNLSELVQSLSGIEGIDDLSLSTNAVLLDKQAESLRRAGVQRLNVSLDTLNEKRFRDITGGGSLTKVLRGLEAAKAAGFAPIKINMVAMKGTNDDEYEDMMQFCLENDFTLRFIEPMPVGDTGRYASGHYQDLSEVKARLARKYELIPSVEMDKGAGPARYMKVANTDLRIGFITPISQHFCETCNRVRLGAEGMLYLCLGDNAKVDLGTLLRQTRDDGEIRGTIVQALALKPERHEFCENPEKVLRFMSVTGG